MRFAHRPQSAAAAPLPKKAQLSLYHNYSYILSQIDKKQQVFPAICTFSAPCQKSRRFCPRFTGILHKAFLFTAFSGSPPKEQSRGTAWPALSKAYRATPALALRWFVICDVPGRFSPAFGCKAHRNALGFRPFCRSWAASFLCPAAAGCPSQGPNGGCARSRPTESCSPYCRTRPRP